MSFAIRKHVKDDYDAPVGITGGTGRGKTTLALNCCMDLDDKFELQRNVLFDPDVKQLHGMIYNMPKYSGICVDEAIRISYKRKWQSANNMFLNELFSLCRYRNQASFFCIPRFTQLDGDLQKLLYLWIHVIDRGVAVIFRQDDNQFSPDPWNLKENYKALKKTYGDKNIFLSKQDVGGYLTSISRLDGFAGVLLFDDLPEEVKNNYKELKKPFEIRGTPEEVAGGRRFQVWRAGLRNSITELYRLGWTQTKLADMIGMNVRIVSDLLGEAGVRPVDKKEPSKAPKSFLSEPL